MYIKDTYTGNVRKYGTDMHDSLRISNDGTCLTYHHLQCGDGSIEGDKEHSGFLFCDDEGHTPEEDEVLCRNGADAFFNIGGWKEPKWIPVSESLPNDRDWYLGIFKEPDTGWINPLPFICDYVGSETKATTKEHWILRGFTDRDERIDYYFNLECAAWMPLPEPYEPQERNDKE
jgi:hypothetical protein